MTFQPHLSADQRIAVKRAEGTSVAEQTRAPEGYTGPPKAKKSSKSKRRRAARERQERKEREAEQRQLAATPTRGETFLPPKVETPTQLSGPWSAAVDVVRLDRAAEKAEQTAGSRDTFQTVREHTDAGFYNLAQARPSAILFPESPIDIHPLVRMRHMPHLALFGGLISGERVEAPVREFGENPEAEDVRVNEAFIEGGGGALVGAFSGLGGAVYDSYGAPVVAEVAEKTQEVSRPFVSTLMDPVRQRARDEELAEIREAKTGRGASSIDGLRSLSLPVEIGGDATEEPKPGAQSNERPVEFGIGAGEVGAIEQAAAEQRPPEPSPVSHETQSRAGLLLASATGGIAGAFAGFKARAKGAKKPKVPKAPATPVVGLSDPLSPLSPPVNEVPSMASTFEIGGGGLVPSGAFESVKSSIANMSPATGALLGAGAGLAGGALIGATVAEIGSQPRTSAAPRRSSTRKRSSSRKKTARRKTTRKTMRRVMKGKGKARGPKRYTREDRSGVVRAKKTYRGKRVHYTKNGQPYVYQANGRVRFVPR